MSSPQSQFFLKMKNLNQEAASRGVFDTHYSRNDDLSAFPIQRWALDPASFKQMMPGLSVFDVPSMDLITVWRVGNNLQFCPEFLLSMNVPRNLKEENVHCLVYLVRNDKTQSTRPFVLLDHIAANRFARIKNNEKGGINVRSIPADIKTIPDVFSNKGVNADKFAWQLCFVFAYHINDTTFIVGDPYMSPTFIVGKLTGKKKWCEQTQYHAALDKSLQPINGIFQLTAKTAVHHLKSVKQDAKLFPFKFALGAQNAQPLPTELTAPAPIVAPLQLPAVAPPASLSFETFEGSFLDQLTDLILVDMTSNTSSDASDLSDTSSSAFSSTTAAPMFVEQLTTPFSFSTCAQTLQSASMGNSSLNFFNAVSVGQMSAGFGDGSLYQTSPDLYSAMFGGVSYSDFLTSDQDSYDAHPSENGSNKRKRSTNYDDTADMHDFDAKRANTDLDIANMFLDAELRKLDDEDVMKFLDQTAMDTFGEAIIQL